MSEIETQQPTPQTERETPELKTEEVTAEAPKKSLTKIYVGAFVIVLVIVLGAIYQMEKEGRSSTNIFGSMLDSQDSNVVVATVNGEKIVNSDLTTSVEQFSQIAAAQGVDISTAEVQAEIRTQALTVLINTTLLKQVAAERGLSVSDEQVEARLETIKSELGGEEVLMARMEELGIDTEQLESDVKDELLIQALLDEVFAEDEIVVSEEEIVALYESAGGEEAGLPPFEEVRDQIENEVRSTKEQGSIDILLEELKGEADISIEGE